MTKKKIKKENKNEFEEVEVPVGLVIWCSLKVYNLYFLFYLWYIYFVRLFVKKLERVQKKIATSVLYANKSLNLMIKILIKNIVVTIIMKLVNKQLKIHWKVV
jgi:hypothetical protein